jgi:cystathionine beta-lyase/cystathionine gamma-synthase
VSLIGGEDVVLAALMTHAATVPEVFPSLGVTKSLIQISVSKEDWEDLTRDLQVALS